MLLDILNILSWISELLNIAFFFSVQCTELLKKTKLTVHCFGYQVTDFATLDITKPKILFDNGAKWAKFLKLALNPPKSAKRIKQTCSPPFWGDVDIKKWSRFFCLGTQMPFFGTWKRLLLPKVPIFKWQKMALPAPRQKNRDHFLTPTSPKNNVEHVCFRRLALLGGF